MPVTPMPSLLDRLVDLGEQPNDIHYSYRQAIRRDLEALLNTKLPWLTWPKWYRELDHSLMSYGLPDFSAMTLSREEGRERLCSTVVETIKKFEPRCIDVVVDVEDEHLALDRTLRLKIYLVCLSQYGQEEMYFASEVDPLCLGINIVD
ncbi:type VI secretion system baseplate subunit TssE [Vibrio sp. SCSIO 43136]|uniref:type VI secretion system baseplate subunit TssE n=1 Tax=Vibrio sp. SCSIO 43136 TaxID=2819101 RepID=UPI0020764591|nr:type VI secretion system baseplate subunit TssE [Vibrio sp. SCSIO 43136]USD67515.1 type VI secretion system baseplate subunit TssE [Vibrio sp. SCSIO 43136]